jgi:hypothetical protein
MVNGVEFFLMRKNDTKLIDDAKLLLVISLPEYLKQTIDNKMFILVGPKTNVWIELEQVEIATLQLLLNDKVKLSSFRSVRR